METMKENLEYLVKHEPDKFLKLVDYKNNMSLENYIDILKNGYHIRDKETYDKMIATLENRTGEPAPKWEYDSIVNKVNIDFDDTEYTSYDLAYWVNMKYSDYGETTTDFATYVKYSIADLDDDDYQGNSSERAYKDGMEKLEYKKSHKY
jgi:hypothetical protein